MTAQRLSQYVGIRKELFDTALCHIEASLLQGSIQPIVNQSPTFHGFGSCYSNFLDTNDRRVVSIITLQLSSTEELRHVAKTYSCYLGSYVFTRKQARLSCDFPSPLGDQIHNSVQALVRPNSSSQITETGQGSPHALSACDSAHSRGHAAPKRNELITHSLIPPHPIQSVGMRLDIFSPQVWNSCIRLVESIVVPLPRVLYWGAWVEIGIRESANMDERRDDEIQLSSR
jgi:hypothetical protein